MAEPETTPWNVPNALTAFRIVLVPLFAWMLLAHPDDPGWRVGTAALFTVAILTDTLDGYLARKHNIVTKFGKLADPIADKALTGMALIGLSIIGELPWWVTIVILVREWGITVMRFAMLRYGVMAAGRGGKIKTVLQAVAIILYLLPLATVAPWAHVVAMIVMGAAFLITVLSGLDYVREAVRIRRQHADLVSGGSAAAVLAALRRRSETLATAESLTGGLVGYLLTSVPGASESYVGGVISYATRLKSTLAGVDPTTLAEHGPVDARTAAEMAIGVCRTCQADWGLATTGVAGPDPQDGHPAGEVYVAVAHPADGLVRVEALRLSGDRQAIRDAAATAALDLLLTAGWRRSPSRADPDSPIGDLSVVRSGVVGGAGYSLRMPIRIPGEAGAPA